MIGADQIPRRALGWLIVCQLVQVLPHLARVPVWILLVYIGAAVWRFQIHRQRLAPPGRLLRVLLGVSAGASIFNSYQTLIGLEPMVALLLVATALKLLESMRIRDGYVLVCLGFFICSTEFLFYQGLPVVLYGVACTVLLVTALIALNPRPATRPLADDPRLAIRMLAMAVPMMVLLFVLFPRIGPLWSVPSKAGQGVTGMSDVLRPGDVTKLGRSAEVAFRVRFDGDIPATPDLYWRGIVLSRLQDGAWRTLSWREHPPMERQLQRPELTGEPIGYRVIFEPTMQRYLYALRYAESPTPGVFEAWDYRLVMFNPVESQVGYSVASWPSAVLQPELSPWRRLVELEFPADENPRSRIWLRREGRQQLEPEELVREVLGFFRSEPFYYTLEPPPIDDQDFVDRFLFDSRRGFCEHYAYSFVALMRMAGIPARIIGGYQGGEINPLNNTVVVRQFDAHAWAEVWLEGRGWVRVDPTAAVSPARIEYGLEAALAGEGSFLADSPFSAYRFRELGAINWLRLRYDAAAWQWQSLVIGFDSEQQFDLLSEWLGDLEGPWLILVILIGWAGVVLPLAWVIRRDRNLSSRLPAEQDFARLCRRLERVGLSRQRGESPVALIERARGQLAPSDPLMAQLEALEARLYRVPPASDPG